ncbi:MAG: hypothetical protein AABX73_04245, partial [Nanoarchaeota archaeon]
MKKPIFIFLIFMIALFLFYSPISIAQDNFASQGCTRQTANNAPINTPEENNNNAIEISSTGFSPQNLVINKGESVTFINKDSKKHRPATDIHPSHKLYPGSSIEKCDSAERDKIFDSCRGLSQEESYSFVFNEIGIWGYHDHLNPQFKGTIT